MVKIEAQSLEDAYAQAADNLECSVTELQVEIIQHPSKGFLGFFKKPAIVVASCNVKKTASTVSEEETPEPSLETEETTETNHRTLNETILPESFVTGQDDEEEALQKSFERNSGVDDRFFEEKRSPEEVADEVRTDINALFEAACFKIDPVEVSVYDEETLLVEFSGEDAALLIGKEGYRYKALSYMIFNWINSKYQMQLRLEIAEFLKNQEESINRYLVGVCESIDRDGRAQTKILDGVLVQIALRELRSRYPDKYVAIRSTRDGSKFIIVNDYNEY
jgi:spoIIIJ-associated protein